MSMSISFVGKFFNGKTRAIGSFVSTNGLNNSKLYLNEDDVLFILKVADMENKSFNYCIDNNSDQPCGLILPNTEIILPPTGNFFSTAKKADNS